MTDDGEYGIQQVCSGCGKIVGYMPEEGGTA